MGALGSYPLLEDSTKRKVRAHIVFNDSIIPWLKIFKQHYRHVSVIVPCGDGYLHIDPRSTMLDFRYVNKEQFADIHDRALFEEIVIVEYSADDIKEGLHVPAVFTCVEVVKRVIGVRAWWVVTPYQLYKHIRALKGKQYV